MVPRAPQEGGAGLRGAPAQKGRWSGRGVEDARTRNLEPGPATPPSPSLESLALECCTQC